MFTGFLHQHLTAGLRQVQICPTEPQLTSCRRWGIGRHLLLQIFSLLVKAAIQQCMSPQLYIIIRVLPRAAGCLFIIHLQYASSIFIYALLESFQMLLLYISGLETAPFDISA